MPYTVYAKLPKKIESDFEKELIKIYKKYGKFRKPKKSKNFVNIPHLTILFIGDKYLEHENKLIKKSLRNFKKFSLYLDNIEIWPDKTKGFSHIVLKIKNTTKLQKIHEKIYKNLKYKIKSYNFILNNYSPHISLITSLNNKKIKLAKKDLEFFLNYKKITFNKICVKYMDEINKAKDVSTFKLKN